MDTALEWFAAATCLASVIFTARRSILCWPVGITSVVAYLFFFARIKLYADCAVQVFFLVTSFFGWWHWARGGEGSSAAPIRVLTFAHRVLTLTLVTTATVASGYLLRHHTDASFPFWDSLAAGLSIGAQVLLMRKFLESWYLWIAVDVLSLGLYAAKAAWVTFGLYGILLALAIAGCIAWQRALARGKLL
jgi:nicotinamide mononucleotide transporter